MTRGYKRKRGDTETNEDNSGNLDKVKEVQNCIDQAQDQVRLAIDKTIQRGDNLDELGNKADNMEHEAQMFNRNAATVQRHFWWQEMKLKLMMCCGIFVILLLIFFIFIFPAFR